MLYVVTTIVYFLALGIWTLSPTDLNYRIAAGCGIFFQVGSGISQMLLCNIFWKLAIPMDEKEFADDRSTVTEDVTIEDFDEDDELMANIWNSLVRKTEESSFIVTAESFRVWFRSS